MLSNIKNRLILYSFSVIALRANWHDPSLRLQTELNEASFIPARLSLAACANLAVSNA